MAENMIVSNGFLQAVGYDFSEIFAEINPAQTATLTQIIAAKGVGAANGTTVSKIVKELSKGATSGGKAEGADAGAAEKSTKTHVKNVTEIYSKVAKVSGTANAINAASYSEELNDRIAEIKEDINVNLLNGTLSEGDPRKMKGLKAFAKNTVTVATVLTEEELDQGIQKLGTKGDVRLAVAPADMLAVQRNLIGDKAAINLTTKEVVAGIFINEYISAQGVNVKIYAEPALATGNYLLYDMDKVEYKELRAMAVEPLAKTGDSESALVVTEVTCICNPGSVVNLAKA